MNRSLRKDLWREICSSRGRFLSIFVMVALGVLFLVGLRSAAPDMRRTADAYFDKQQFMDLEIASTLGLTEEDVAAFAAADGVTLAEGAWSVDAILKGATSDHVVKAESLSAAGINIPILTEGRLPVEQDECAVEQRLLAACGVSVGDTITLSPGEGNDAALVTDTFRITGVVESPLYISLDRGNSTLGDGSVSGYLLLPGESFSLEAFTCCYLLADGAKALDAYGTSYTALIDGLSGRMKALAETRADLRHETLISDGQAEIDDAQRELNLKWIDLLDGQAELDRKRAEAEEKLADGQQALADARQELDDGWSELETNRDSYQTAIADGNAQLDAARAKLDNGWSELADAKAELNDAQYQLDTQSAGGQAELQAALDTLNGQQATYDAQAAALADTKAQLQTAKAQLDAYAQALAEQEALSQTVGPVDGSVDQGTYDAMAAAYAQNTAAADAADAQLAAAKSQLDAAWSSYHEKTDAAQAQMAAAQGRIDSGWGDYYASRQELQSGEATYTQSAAELETQTADGQTQLDEAEQKLTDGEASYQTGLTDLDAQKADADRELSDAQQELSDGLGKLMDGQEQIDRSQRKLGRLAAADVYVLDRNSNYGFVSYDQNAQRMANLSAMFPLLFFVVAALVCLTTMTRMVEEQRTEIGAIKAMGYGTWTISLKFLCYGAIAAAGGGILGAIVGTTLIPWVIFTSYNIMYALPSLSLKIYWPLCLLSCGAGIACTAAATLAAMLSTARETPAALMRPRAPKPGKRILLEHIPFLWRRMNFSMKVSARNLFRYKKRLFMTVIGIAGCTALIIAGMGLRHGIFAVIDRQYGTIYTYSLSVSLDDTDPAGCQRVMRFLQSSADVASLAENSTRSVTFAGKTPTDGYLVVTDDPAALCEEIQLRTAKGTPIDISDGSAVVTQKLSELLNVRAGDQLTVESGGKTVSVPISAVTEHYVRHYAYLTAKTYEALFDTSYTPNTVLVSMADPSEATISALTETLLTMDAVTSATNLTAAASSFRDTIKAVNAAVVIIILSAAALALVVLFNLTNINITERIREIATIKVLGFYDGEVAMYIYRENIVLTVLGIALGQLLGRFLCTYLVRTVEIELVMFGRYATASSYLFSIVLSAAFAVLVNFFMYFRMKKIDMVQSLKSVE